VPGVIVLHGEEGWFASEAARTVRESFLGEEDEGLVLRDAPRTASDPEGARLGAVLDEARTVPMFGGRKVIWYRASSLDDGERKALAEAAGSRLEFSRLVVSLRKLGKAAAAALTKAGAAVADARRLFDTPWPGRPETDTPLNKWAAGRAGRRGLRMSLATAHLLTGQLGNDLGRIDSAIEKLATAAKGRREIDESAVRALTGGGRGFDAFAFGDAIYDRDERKAWRVSRNAFSEGMEDARGRRDRSPSFVAGRLLWSVGFRLKDVYRAARLLAEGRSEEEAIRGLGRGRHPAAIRAVGQARRFPIETLRRHHVLLAEAEAVLRSALPQEVVVERLIPVLTETADA